MVVPKLVNRVLLAVLATGSVALVPAAAPAQEVVHTVVVYGASPDTTETYAYGRSLWLLTRAIIEMRRSGWEPVGCWEYGYVPELGGNGYWQYLE